MKSDKSKPIGILVGNLFVSVIVVGTLLTLLAATGCPEAQNMMKPVVNEPADTTPPTTVGEMKKSEERPAESEMTKREETPTEEEMEPPTDTTPPMVTEVSWYGDWQMTQSLTTDSAVRPGDTVYTVIRFSEPVVHRVADDNTARPALFIVVDDKATRYKMLPHGVGFDSGEAKPLHSNAEYLCKYTIPTDTAGTLALRVGSATADTAGNRIAEAVEHAAPFMATKPAEEPQSVVTNPPPRKELTPQERAEEIVMQTMWLIDEQDANDFYLMSLLVEQGTGLDFLFIGDVLFKGIYLDERPEEKDLPFSWYDIVLEYFRLSFTYPDASEEELLAHFRQSVKDGRVELDLKKSAFVQKLHDENRRIREGVPDAIEISRAIFDREVAALKQKAADPSFDIDAERDTIFQEEAGLSFDFVHNTLLGIYLRENPEDQRIIDAGIYYYAHLISTYLLHGRAFQEESEEQILERFRRRTARGFITIKLDIPLEEY